MRRLVERALAPAYRRMRRLKNQALNRLDPPVVVLAYHRVAAKAFDPHQTAVSPENFRAHMHYLKSRFRHLRLDGDWAGREGPAVAVTFDDGYADNLLEALPVLEEAGIPATFFVSTFVLEESKPGSRHEYWWDEVERLVLRGGDRPRFFRLEGLEGDRLRPASTPEDRAALHDDLCRLLAESGASRRAALLAELRAWAGSDPGATEPSRLLTPSEVRTLAASRWATVGAHTVTHTSLSALGEAEQRDEIGRSKRDLESLLGRPVATFAYPFGSRRDFDRTSVRLCREAGFRRAVSTLPGQAHRWTDPWQVPRQLVRNWDLETFAARLASFWA